MVFDSISEEQRKRFFRQSYAAHLPGYTGHCPTLKFRVGKRFGACTQEIMKELLEKKILKTGPYRPNSRRSTRENGSIVSEKDGSKADWKSDAHLFKTSPYIMGYTGYIPGFNSKFGMSFMRAVEEGAKEWREKQIKLRVRRDVMRAEVERHSDASRNLLSRARADNVAVEIDHDQDHDQEKYRPTTFHYEISPERPPIVGYTGHIPGAKGEVALSKGYTQAAKKGLEMVRQEREQRHSKLRDVDTAQRIYDLARFDETALTRA
ncbi:Protein FAM166B [Anthophora retusa]